MPDPVAKRLDSLDALRGADMLLIIGMDGVLWALSAFLPGRAGDLLRGQLAHVPWQGLSMYDLIFPLFVFISGVAMHFSLARAAEQGRSRWKSALLLVRRALLLVAMGWLVNKCEVPSLPMRYASVLGLIGISCAVAGGVALLLRRVWQRVAVAVLLLGAVGVAQALGGEPSPSACVNAWIDQWLCPGRLHLGVLDPEGPLCVVSASALCLGGMAAGALLSAGGSRWRRAASSAGIGLGLLLVSLCCGPCIKNIWTPAFVLASAGVSFVLLGLFHYLFDTPSGAAWAMPLRVVGANALFIYMVTHAIPFGAMVKHLPVVQSACGVLPEALVPVAMALCVPALAWLLCLYLWRRRIFIRV